MEQGQALQRMRGFKLKEVNMYDLFAITLSQENADEYNVGVISSLLDNVNQEFNRLGSVRKITVIQGGKQGQKSRFLFICDIDGDPGARIFTNYGRDIISSENATLEDLGFYREFASWPRKENETSTSSHGQRGLSLSDE